jgi:hypothetical protein
MKLPAAALYPATSPWMRIAEPDWETVPGVKTGVTIVVAAGIVVTVWTGVGVTGAGVTGLVVGRVRVEAGGWVSPCCPVHPLESIRQAMNTKRTAAVNRSWIMESSSP